MPVPKEHTFVLDVAIFGDVDRDIVASDIEKALTSHFCASPKQTWFSHGNQVVGFAVRKIPADVADEAVSMFRKGPYR